MTKPVIFEERSAANGKSIGVALLNVEKTLNSLTLEMVELMLEKFLAWQDDDNIAAVFIHAAGEKAFCAGGDVKALHDSAIATPGGPCVEAEAFYEREYRLDYLLHTFAKPIISWGHGIVMGGGLGVFAGCEHRVVTEKTRIAMPEVTIALFPDVGGSYFLNRMPGQCGRFLAFTAASINAADSLYTGLAEYFSVHAKKEAVLAELQKISFSGDAKNDSTCIAKLLRSNEKTCISEMPDGNLESNQRLIDQLCAGDDIEEIFTQFAALETDDKWMQRAKSGIAGGSPLALKRILRQLTLSKGLSLEEVFKSEMLLVTNVVRDPEFAEGVRALLIDKDLKPQWQFKTLAEVPESFVDDFFKAPWPNNPLANL